MMDELFEVLLGFITMPVFYIAGKMDLLKFIEQRFYEWASSFTMNTKTKNGLSPETKQAILDDFMKGCE